MTLPEDRYPPGNERAGFVAENLDRKIPDGPVVNTAVHITDLDRRDESGDVITYVASTLRTCLDPVDARVFRLVNEHRDMITIGKTIGVPVRNDGNAGWVNRINGQRMHVHPTAQRIARQRRSAALRGQA